jgi:hypothetical protein
MLISGAARCMLQKINTWVNDQISTEPFSIDTVKKER